MAGPGAIGALMMFLPRLPLLGSTALYHTLGWSETAKYWTLKTTLIINIIRSFITDGPKYTISQVQKMSTAERPVKGRMWISRITVTPPPEDALQQALAAAIDGLKAPALDAQSFAPATGTFTAEWTGYRAAAAVDEPEPEMSEAQKYAALMEEVTDPTTILYFHGGAFFLLDPISHRPLTARLARLVNGRTLSVRYRLAPQHPFPAALLDALISYLTLLYPPPGALHEPVRPEHIVFAGDSAGGNLCLALLQTILELRRQNRTITWYGAARDLPVPAAVATQSPWLDISSSSPSCDANHTFDYLTPSALRAEGNHMLPCAAWPASPHRANLYVRDDFVSHPLVSPLAAQDWTGSCPVYIQTGQELLTDEDKYVAARMAQQGVPVVFEEYEAMPHCFAMVLSRIPAAERCFDSEAAFIRRAVADPATMETRGTLIRADTLREEPLDVTAVATMTAADVQSNMARREQAVREFLLQQSVPSKL